MRRVSADERAFLVRYFGAGLAIDRIWIGSSLGRRSWSPFGARISLARALFRAGDARAEVALADPHAASVFAHEALHVWQRQHGRRVSREAAPLQVRYALGLCDPYAYDRGIRDPAALLSAFALGNVEQQARIFQDFVFADCTGCDTDHFQQLAGWVRHCPAP